MRTVFVGRYGRGREGYIASGRGQTRDGEVRWSSELWAAAYASSGGQRAFRTAELLLFAFCGSGLRAGVRARACSRLKLGRGRVSPVASML